MDPLRTGFASELLKVAFSERGHGPTGPKNALMLPALFGAAHGMERERPTAGVYGAAGGGLLGSVGGALAQQRLRPGRGIGLAGLLVGGVGGAMLGARIFGGKKGYQAPDYEVKGRAILIKMPHEEAALAVHKPFGFDSLSPRTKQDWVRGMMHYVEHQRRRGEPIGG